MSKARLLTPLTGMCRRFSRIAPASFGRFGLVDLTSTLSVTTPVVKEARANRSRDRRERFFETNAITRDSLSNLYLSTREAAQVIGPEALARRLGEVG